MKTYKTDLLDLRCMDCMELMRDLPDNSVDSIVTDPPYGLSFMGKKWDYDVPSEAIWRECLRVLKPGGHLLAFAGTRTQHRMAVRIEDAGFEIRDMIAWVYGSGFPKSLNVGKAIDKAAGAEREVVTSGKAVKRMIPGADQDKTGSWIKDNGREFVPNITAPATEAAKQWDGFGTSLKPSLEPITVARKPLAKGNTVAANVLEHGTGAINVDGCRVGMSDSDTDMLDAKSSKNPTGVKSMFGGGIASKPHTQGRWPANLIHDGSDEVVGLFPVTAQVGAATRSNKRNPYGSERTWSTSETPAQQTVGYPDSGSAARFFYCAKASKRDRDEGCEGLDERFAPTMGNGIVGKEHDPETATPKRNHHPTVKPTALMRYLCRLVTPPAGTVLDPFMGSGSTGKAAVLEGFRFIGSDMSEEYFEIAKARTVAATQPNPKTAQQEMAL